MGHTGSGGTPASVNQVMFDLQKYLVPTLKPKIESEHSMGGQSKVWLPNCIPSRILWAIGEAERIKKFPPGTSVEVTAVLQMTYSRYSGHGLVYLLINNIYREDQIYVDNQFTYYSLSPDGPGKEQYENFTMKFRRLYPGYCLNKEMQVIAKRPPFMHAPSTPKLSHIVDLFKSKDEQLWKENAWIFDGNFRYLDGSPNLSNKVSFSSFPRSGNSFLRRYIELITGITTGSD